MNYNSYSPDTVFYQQIQQPVRYRYERAYPQYIAPKFVQHQICTLCHNPIPISSKYDSYPAVVGICPSCFEQMFNRQLDVPIPVQQYTQPVKKAKKAEGAFKITPIKPIPIRTTIDKKVEEDLRTSKSMLNPVDDTVPSQDTSGLDILSEVASEASTPVEELQQQQDMNNRQSELISQTQPIQNQSDSFTSTATPSMSVSSDVVAAGMVVDQQTMQQQPPLPPARQKRRHVTPKAQFLVCSTCSQTKPYKEFTTKRTGERTRTCKVCSERKKNYYQRNICKRRRYDDDAYYF